MTFQKTFSRIKQFAPDNAKIVVVDDASQIPCRQATFRFNTNVGIAVAKNKCLELLDDCEHIFLFDDDCYPKISDWWKPYVESAEPHLMYVFEDFASGRKLNDNGKIYETKNLVGYSHPRGCMLYFDRKVLDVVGGYDTRFKKWGYEHVDISNRIFNNHLTTFRFGDLPDSNRLFHSGDEHEQAKSTVRGITRRTHLAENEKLYRLSYSSKKYCNYKTPAKQNNIILTSYITGQIDTQTNKVWQPKFDDLKTLINSCEKQKQKIVILNNCFDLPDTQYVQWVKTDSKINPYFQRWLSQYQYLRDHPEIDQVFISDATDTELLNSPFEEMTDRLYVGDEPSMLNCSWMRSHFNTDLFKEFLVANRNKVLLNAGVVGGTRQTVMELCHEIQAAYFDNPKTIGSNDMGIFNLLCYTKHADKLEFGRHVTTIFKKFERTSAWIRHK